MSEHKDERWLDNELRQAIGQTNLQFDAEAWKHNHAEAYGALLARRNDKAATMAFWPKLRAGSTPKLAAAAIILFAVTLTLLMTRPKTSPQPVLPKPPRLGPASTEIVTFLSLRMTYRQGGEDALNKQLDTAQETLGPRPDRSLLSDVLDDLRS